MSARPSVLMTYCRLVMTFGRSEPSCLFRSIRHCGGLAVLVHVVSQRPWGSTTTRETQPSLATNASAAVAFPACAKDRHPGVRIFEAQCPFRTYAALPALTL